jgi:benzoyl-CoA reductase/2-hydroxyglutaryl-CoA dehydratase subunit BcrC/BadD/HgdB
MPIPADVGDLVSRLCRDLSTIEIDRASRTTLDSALSRFSALEHRRRLLTALADARRHRDWIAAQLAFLAELDDITERESDSTVFEEMALLFDEIVAAAGAAAVAIREGTALPASDADGLPRRACSGPR